MSILNTKHKRKSALITASILMLLIWGIFNYGMQYLDPPKEYGLAINFGDSNVGSVALEVKSKKTATKEVVKTASVSKELKETPKETIIGKVITKETAKKVFVVEKGRNKKRPLVKEAVKKETPKVIPKPKPSKENIDALNKLLSGNSFSGKQKGKGDDGIEGMKGEKNSTPVSAKYYGNTGSGAAGNYNLAGRKALSKPKIQPDCQEEGIVVVQITVGKNGKVIRAIPGVKGSTNTALCLLKPAKKAALKTLWNTDNNAPKIQTGTIIYRFSLSK